MAKLADIFIKLGAKTTEFETNLNRAARKAEKDNKAMRAAFTNTVKSIAKITSVASIAGGGIAALAARQIEAADKTNQFAQRIGISTEALTRLQYAAEQTGQSSDSLNLGLQRMTRRVSEAAAGTGEAQKALEELGLSAGRLNELAPDQQFAAIAQAMKGVSNDQDRLRLAVKLFDSEAAGLVNTLGLGVEGLNQMAMESDRTGNTLSESAAAGASEAQGAFDRLNRSFGGLLQTMAISLAPMLEGLANFLSQKIPPAVAFTSKAIVSLRKALVDFVNVTAGGIESLIGVLGRIPGPLQASYAVASAEIKNFRKILDDQADDYEEQIKKMEEGGESFAFVQGEIADVMTDKVTPAMKEQEEAAKRLEKETRDQERATQALLDRYLPMQAAQREAAMAFDSLVDLYQNGKLSADDYAEAVANVGRELTGVTEAAEATPETTLAKPFTDAASAIATAFDATFQALSDGTFRLTDEMVNAIEDTTRAIASLFDGAEGNGFGDLFKDGNLYRAAGQAIAQNGNSYWASAASGALAGAQVGSWWGAAIGAVVGALGAWVQTMEEGNLRVRVTNGETAGTFGSRTFLSESAFGMFGLDMADGGISNDTLRQLLRAIGDFDDAIAGFLDPDQIAAVRDALSGSEIYNRADVDIETILQDRLQTILRTIEPEFENLVMGFRSLEDQLSAVGALLSLREFTEADFGADIAEFLSLQAQTFTDQVLAQGGIVADLASGWDGSLQGLTALQTETERYYAMQLQLVAQIRQAAENVAGIIQGGQDSIRLANMNDTERRQFLRGRRADLVEELRNAIDPAEITRLVAEIERYTQDILGLSPNVDPNDVIAFLDSIGVIANRRLDVAEAGAVSEVEATQAAIADFLQSATDATTANAYAAQNLNDAASRFSGSVDRFDGATQRGINVNIRYVDYPGEVIGV